MPCLPNLFSNQSDLDTSDPTNDVPHGHITTQFYIVYIIKKITLLYKYYWLLIKLIML